MTTAKTPKAPNPRTPANARSEISPGVFVGGWNDALGFEGRLFCVLDEPPEGIPNATHIPIYDERNDRADTKQLDRLAAAVSTAHADGLPVLIFCGHGVRRSPLAAAWYLRRAEGLPLSAAYERIRAVRPKVEPARAWLGNADELEQA
ncbi:MAG: dual specificity protein phosphatase family protein [Thermoplasmata archaeon]|nr:dual specificity protein phosphatase family protein [Thermoplasmata archaeon]